MKIISINSHETQTKLLCLLKSNFSLAETRFANQPEDEYTEARKVNTMHFLPCLIQFKKRQRQISKLIDF